MARSNRIRKSAEFLPESTVKVRKSYYIDEKQGYLNKKVQAANPMGAMMSPDMMNGMLKQNVQGIIHMMMFQVVGSIFQGFITAQVPFPLGHKFK